MQWLNAAMWWWLAPLAAVVIALYILKLRRNEARVPSVMLWDKLLADFQANAPFQRLRITLLLLLQLLILALLTAAVARPFERMPGAVGKRTVLVMDASASMQATDVAPSRFEQARQKARQLVDAMQPGDRAMVIAAGAAARVALGFTNSAGQLREALNALEPTDGPSNLRDALILAVPMAGDEGEIVVFSDGAVPDISDLDLRGRALRFVRVGERSDNFAIVALNVRPVGKTQQVFVGLANFANHDRSAVLRLRLDGKLIDARQVHLTAGQRGGELVALSADDGLLEADLDSPDDLAVDNIARTFLRSTKPLQVLLMSPGNIFLEQALALQPGITVLKGASLPPTEKADAPGPSEYDLVVFDRVPAPAVKARAVWYIAASGVDSPATLGAALDHPRIVDWDRQHPLTRFVNFATMQPVRAQRLEPQPWGNVLLEGPNGAPLIVAGDWGGRRRIAIGFDLLQSDFPLQVGFPIFLSNCIEWSAGAATRQPLYQVNAGSTLTLPAPAGADRLSVLPPSGRGGTLPVSGGQAVLTELNRVGVYRIEGNDYVAQVAVNLLDPAESDLTPHDTLPVAGGAAKSEWVINREFWRWLAMCALVGLCAEWLLFHRRF